MEKQRSLEACFEKGVLVEKKESLEEIRERVAEELTTLHPGHKRFINPH